MSANAYYGLTRDELAALFARGGVNAHQARHTFQALYRHGVLDPAEMPEVSGTAKAYLSRLEPPRRLEVAHVQRAQDGTVKLRIPLGNLVAGTGYGTAAPEALAVEAVVIPTPGRVTLCVSSQAGCAAGCAFCHTGTMGLLRNLEAWEILEQVRLARPHAPQPLTNIVFMGMGEPLHNEAHVLRACRILNDPAGAGISRRRLIVSTAGVGNRLRPFWDEDAAALSISLHATTDEVRDRIIPMNKSWNLGALRATLLEIPWRKREILTVAYLLLDGVNDAREDARRLAQWCAGLPVKVNLLEFNPFPGSGFRRTGPGRLAEFRQWLHTDGVFNTHRHSRGEEVMAACGQLATAGKRAR
ncbi:MAG: 23S rRNA (adenine(2503)-C(2))-methyltransferase RlmN [Planctomycetes bacterium]|nr:23S rRNA (adenine(2503)-C(2))-methyltransferase RlmN [Planctomycetota bacterium]